MVELLAPHFPLVHTLSRSAAGSGWAVASLDSTMSLLGEEKPGQGSKSLA